MNNEIQSIIVKAEDTLQTAKFGYDDLVSGDRRRRYSAIRNLVVFGRSVTFVLQNLKTPVGEDKFNAWYGPIQDEMKNDVLMRYFVTLRNEILKQGKLPVSFSATVNINPGDMQKLGTPPPGAKGFFIGDQHGGCGWEIELLDGSTEKYYVDIPESMAKVQQHFSELPDPGDHNLKKQPIEDLCKYYLSKLEVIIDSARLEFLDEEVKKIGGKRLPPYIKVIK